MKLLGLSVYTFSFQINFISRETVESFDCTDKGLLRVSHIMTYGDGYGSTKFNYSALTATQTRNFENLNS